MPPATPHSDVFIAVRRRLFFVAFPVSGFFFSLSLSLFVFSHPLHKSNRCEARHRCGYLFIYYHNEAALLGLFPASSFSTSPRASTAVISSPHLISLPERDHTHRHHHRLVSFQGLGVFFLPLLVVQFQSGFFAAPDPPPLCASIMPLFALIMCPLGVGAEVEVLCHCQLLLLDCLFVISVLLILQKSTRDRQREGRGRRGRKIFATSQSCLVVSSPGPM